MGFRRYMIAMVMLLTFTAPRARAQDRAVSEKAFPGNRYVHVRLVLDAEALVPGKASRLGVLFDIANGWHLYWRNPGDSGLPPKVTWTLPPGLTIGEAEWPGPSRHVQSGMMVDYIYRDQLMLIYPVTVSKGAVRKDIPISANIDWLVCSDKCVAGRVRLTATLDTAAATAPSKDLALFEKFQKRVPRHAAAERAAYQVRWEAKELVFHSPGASRLTFFPHQNEAEIYPDDMAERGESASDTLRLTYPGKLRMLKSLRGVLAVTRAGEVNYYETSVPPPGGPSSVQDQKESSHKGGLPDRPK